MLYITMDHTNTQKTRQKANTHRGGTEMINPGNANHHETIRKAKQKKMALHGKPSATTAPPVAHHTRPNTHHRFGVYPVNMAPPPSTSPGGDWAAVCIQPLSDRGCRSAAGCWSNGEKWQIGSPVWEVISLRPSPRSCTFPWARRGNFCHGNAP
ncbi:hypothetical protein, unlikely [Trypanosoma brucei gambiense DAL972]|uniref:Uncharacterized protein n=1 Tax=Trypanosoma brucei gambiense (strain MHOM/CI/86/DAL972) TaxID=679716 RepID=C9ZNE8_TRYB9|nr:hypothetical protein, unlikely [Trypanosoma brucei gambiense DAL972]CBH10926.1 hypothetical protein, unlikely [Trypanosoma brucei gambiense DAL972]|eukprot:XP_011773213.1 hypothetical protein, unlikely [Trypanosoma brucei gambiense DAL972]